MKHSQSKSGKYCSVREKRLKNLIKARKALAKKRSGKN